MVRAAEGGITSPRLTRFERGFELSFNRVPALAAGAIPARRVVKLSANPDTENQARQVEVPGVLPYGVSCNDKASKPIPEPREEPQRGPTSGPRRETTMGANAALGISDALSIPLTTFALIFEQRGA